VLVNIVRWRIPKENSAQAWMPRWDALIVPGSKQGEVWTELESLTVEPTQP